MKKLALAWAFIASHVVPALVLAAIVFFLVTRVQSCGDKKQTEQAAVMKERIRVDTLIDSANTAALARRNEALELANHSLSQSLANIQASRKPIPVGTPHDSVVHLSQALKSCRDDADTLVKSVIQFRSSCQAFRDTATKTIADLRLARSHLDSLLKIGKPPKRWGIGIVAGWGLHSDQSFDIKRGAFVGIGVTRSIIQW